MKIIKTLAASAIALGLATGAATAQDIQLKLHHFLSPKAPAHSQMLAPWAKRVEEASNGRVSIEIFPSMTLGGKPPQLPRQARDGVVDLVWIVNAYAAGAFPRTEVFELPGVHQGDNAAVNKAMMAMYDDYLAEDFKGVIPMFQHVHQGQAMQMASDQIRSPADLAGKKIRVPSRTGSWVLEALGASPVQTSVGEIPVALSKKVIDGALIPWEIIPALKIHEVTDYQIEGPGGKRLGTTSFSVLMNEAKWDSLPADIQAIFREVSNADWHAEVGKVWAEADAHGIEVAVNSGNTHIQLTEEEWGAFDARTASVVDRWIADMDAKGIDGRALYDRAVELVNQNMASN
ncbi:TRAP transporter substrate-binding protein [Pseudophaeobacter leonis]|uniref:TRAP transporter substrate-binding protein n=1 Tax=Pseudophaeobacter leonis TaxID=1144477 RepID=UPI0009F62A55|nr:TRAP transporter substrate-binding protein [Pseudophaeobacter leonis]